MTWARTDGSGASGADIRVAPGQLAQDTYTFNVTVVRPTDSLSFRIATWVVQVRQTPAVPITLSVPWYANQPVPVQTISQLAQSSARLMVGDACGMAPDVEWIWALVADASPSTILLYLDTIVTNLTLPGEIAVSAGALPDEYLVPGDSYALALLETGSSPRDLAQAELLGLRFARSVPFVADGAPSGGYLACVPDLGTALETEFWLATSGWYDEDLVRLKYSFYRFPIPTGVSLAAAAGSSLFEKLRRHVEIEPNLFARFLWEMNIRSDA